MSFIMMRYPKGLEKALTLSYDDGVAQDIRLIEIMSKNGLKGTFNINAGLIEEQDAVGGKGRMSKKQIINLYKDSGNEVAVHTYTHPNLAHLTPELISHEVLRDREEIEEMFGTIVRGMAYPNGGFNDKVVNCLKSCGIAYSRTTITTGGFSVPTDWLRMETTCRHQDPHLFELLNKFIEAAPRSFDPCMLFYLWGHSYEFDDNNNWDRIEEFAKKAGGRDDIWYATNIEIYDYVHAYEQLRFNIAKTFVFNPTSTDVWICVNGKIYEIKAGTRVSLS